MTEITQQFIDAKIARLTKLGDKGTEPEVYFRECFDMEVKQSKYEAITAGTAEVIAFLADGRHIHWDSYQIDRLIAAIPENSLVQLRWLSKTVPEEIQAYCQGLCRYYQIPARAPAVLLRSRFPETVNAGELITIFRPRDLT
ncbi:MAG: hypothetical protein Q7U57_14205 [Methylovulum sp.]|nr:hypothetical protein [Methylovulum sp.]